MPAGRRNERVAEEIREEVAQIIGRELKDPRIGFVTVTRVTLTPDLRTAHVNVGILGDASQHEKTLDGLRKAAGFVRREVGRRIRMRHTPELVFHYDEGLDATERVAKLLAENPPASDPDSEPHEPE
jgi:ribosome-binding factor A